MLHPHTIVPSRRAVIAAAAATLASAAIAVPAHAATARELSARSVAALDQLYASNPKARELGTKARAVLVFPSITKAGFVVGGQGGEGAMLVGGRPEAFFNIGAASIGFQAGAQKFGYALFFITTSSLDYLKKSSGWSIGTGPSVVIVDEGFAKNFNTTTLTQDVYAIAFNQRGLMAGAGLEGSKISRIYPNP